MTLENIIVTESRSFNAQLLPSNISAASGSASDGLSFTYYANGNMYTQNISPWQNISPTSTTTYSQSYGYDALNRLASASEPGGWSQNYCYDAWGNRVVTTGAVSGNQTPTGTCSPGPLPYDARNHWSGAPTDVAGNVISDGLSSFTYDSENRMLQSTGRGTVQYTYNGDGQRVQKSGPNGTVVYVYDADGIVASEYASQTQSTCSPSPCFVTQDQLGSTRMVLDATGHVVRRRDFFPFGEEIPQGTNGRPSPDYQMRLQQTLPDFFNWNFTGQERDTETTLDFFQTRYYSGAQGRFTSPDEPLADQNPTDPQSWNLYSYVRNNPLKYTDPTGEDCVYISEYAETGQVGVQEGRCRQPGGIYVNGTIDKTSLTYDPRNNSLSVGYTDPSGTVSATSIDLPSRPDAGLAALQRAGQLAAPGVNAAAAGTAIVMGGIFVATAYPIVADALLVYRAAQAAAALKAAQEAWKRIPLEQRQAVMNWLSKIKPGAPSPGPLPPGANIEALKAYREVAIHVIQSGKDVVGTQQLRVNAIDRALGGR